MAIPIQCDGCGKKYRVDESYAGRRMKCRICGQRMGVPEPFDPAAVSSASSSKGDSSREAVVAHFERHIGKPDSMLREPGHDPFAVDIHVIPATAERPYLTLFTAGMSDRPMAMPPDADGEPFAELLLCLPSDWPLTAAAFKNEARFWPIRWLKTLARLPFELKTWLGRGFTIPNGDPLEPYADNTRLCCALLAAPTIANEDFAELDIRADKVVNILALYFLYPEEVEYKLKHGEEALTALLADQGITEVLDPERPVAVRRRGGRR